MASKPGAARKAVKARRRPGPKGHQPTAGSRSQAKLLAGLGLPQSQIALLLGIDAKTLRKHYEHEMAAGEAEATRAVAATLFDRATRQKDLGAAVFWLKCRAGWREKLPDQTVNHRGEVAHAHSGEVVHRVMTDEQRAAVLAAVRARAVSDDVGAAGGGAPAD